MAYKHIVYETENPPANGETMLLAPGLRWVRQPLPFALEHINVWVLFDDQHFSIVDTGFNSKTSRSIWQRVIADELDGLAPDKIIATHLHPDHVGLAGWLCETLERPLWMTSEEYFLCRLLCDDTGKPAPPEGVSFYQSAGLDKTALTHYQKNFGNFGKYVSPLPQNYNRIQESDVISIGTQRWRVIIGNGHSPEHACLFDEEHNVVISGDQLLPNISSIVAVWPTEPAANPLANWLASCRKLLEELPEDVLVLPSHGLPFRGAHVRLQALIDHHHQNLEELVDYCEQPRRAIDVFDVLFGSPINSGNLIMAIGESLAHFNYLLNEGIVDRSTDENGVHWFHHP